MCSNCNSSVTHGVAALEALANGEEIPPVPEPEVETETVPVCLPFPVVMTVTDAGFVGIMTSPEGGDVIKAFLKSIGHHPDDCDRHH